MYKTTNAESECSFCKLRRDFVSTCIASCTVVHCTVLSSQLEYQRDIFCIAPTQISTDGELLLIWLFHTDIVIVHISNKLHICLSRWLLVPEHHSVFSLFMGADKMHFVSRAPDESRGILMDLYTQTASWIQRVAFFTLWWTTEKMTHSQTFSTEVITCKATEKKEADHFDFFFPTD